MSKAVFETLDESFESFYSASDHVSKGAQVVRDLSNLYDAMEGYLKGEPVPRALLVADARRLQLQTGREIYVPAKLSDGLEARQGGGTIGKLFRDALMFLIRLVTNIVTKVAEFLDFHFGELTVAVRKLKESATAIKASPISSMDESQFRDVVMDDSVALKVKHRVAIAFYPEQAIDGDGTVTVTALGMTGRVSMVAALLRATRKREDAMADIFREMSDKVWERIDRYRSGKDDELSMELMDSDLHDRFNDARSKLGFGSNLFRHDDGKMTFQAFGVGTSHNGKGRRMVATKDGVEVLNDGGQLMSTSLSVDFDVAPSDLVKLASDLETNIAKLAGELPERIRTYKSLANDVRRAFSALESEVAKQDADVSRSNGMVAAAAEIASYLGRVTAFYAEDLAAKAKAADILFAYLLSVKVE